MQGTITRLASALSLTALSLCAQPAATPRLFDVASIKKVDGACPAGPPIRLTPGRLVLHCWTARQLIAFAHSPLTAYDHDNIPVIGGPLWITSVRYDIEAKSEGATVTDLTGVMLLDLLTERFHLQTHKEPRSTPVYLLTVAPGGPKLKPADSSACVIRDTSIFPPPPIPPDGPVEFCGRTASHTKDGVRVIDSYSVPLEAFAAVLSSHIGRPVVDRTGLTGTWDIHLESAPESISSGPVMLNGEPASSPNPDDSRAVSVFTAIQKQLGLKLTAGTAPIDVVVVDSIDEPTAN